MKTVLTSRLGAPTRVANGTSSTALGPSASGQVLEWLSERTVAVLREHGNEATSGSLVVVTRAYLELTRTRRNNVAIRPSTPYAYPWFLQLIEGFGWARNGDGLGTSGDFRPGP